MHDRFFVFDLDGVIVDSEHHWKAIESEFLAGLISGWGPADQARVIGMSAYDVYELLVKDYGLTKSRSHFVGYYDGLSEEIYGRRVSLIEGFLELYRDLLAHRVVLGVASSSPRSWIRIVLDRFGLDGFKAVSSSDDVGGRGKPAPDVYLHALRGLNATVERTAAIEDTEKGILSAKAAGLRCIGFENGFHTQNLCTADLVVSKLQDLTFDRIEETLWRGQAAIAGQAQTV